MKKLMFSAVALVAFSFAGMASNGEVEEIKIVNNKEIVNNEPLEEVKSCGLQYLDDRERYSNWGIIEEVALDMAWNNFQNCLGLN